MHSMCNFTRWFSRCSKTRAFGDSTFHLISGLFFHNADLIAFLRTEGRIRGHRISEPPQTHQRSWGQSPASMAFCRRLANVGSLISPPSPPRHRCSTLLATSGRKIKIFQRRSTISHSGSFASMLMKENSECMWHLLSKWPLRRRMSVLDMDFTALEAFFSITRLYSVQL